MNVDDTGLFKGEQPEPISMGRKSTSPKKKRSLSAKKKKTSSFSSNTQSMKSLKKKVANKKPSTVSKPLPEWNDNSTASKYFDPSVDPKEMRHRQNQERN